MDAQNNLECKVCKKELTGRKKLFCCEYHKIRFHNENRTIMYHTVTRKEQSQYANTAIFTKGILSVACQTNLHNACKEITKRWHKCRCICHK